MTKRERDHDLVIRASVAASARLLLFVVCALVFVFWLYSGEAELFTWQPFLAGLILGVVTTRMIEGHTLYQAAKRRYESLHGSLPEDPELP